MVSKKKKGNDVLVKVKKLKKLSDLLHTTSEKIRKLANEIEDAGFAIYDLTEGNDAQDNL